MLARRFPASPTNPGAHLVCLRAQTRSANASAGGSSFRSRVMTIYRALSQDHIVWPIIVRCLPAVQMRRVDLMRRARPECPIFARLRVLVADMAVGVMPRNLRRE